jgi:hypothetical protein
MSIKNLTSLNTKPDQDIYVDTLNASTINTTALNTNTFTATNILATVIEATGIDAGTTNSTNFVGFDANLTNVSSNQITSTNVTATNRVLCNILAIPVESQPVINYAVTTTATITSPCALVEWTNVPVTAGGTSLTFTINYAALQNINNIVQITVDANGSGTDGLREWVACIDSIGIGTMEISAIFTSSVGLSNNLNLRFHILIITSQ